MADGQFSLYFPAAGFCQLAMRRARTIALAAFTLGSAWGSPASLELAPVGSPRPIPSGFVGGSCEPLTERMVGDSTKLAAMRELPLGELRFPGGSGSNYYDWHTGLYDFQTGPQSSPYLRLFLANSKQEILGLNPHGVRLEDFEPFAHAIGASFLLVANLETSTVEDQAAWFRHLKSVNVLPTDIELGNEFWIAMGFDPDSLRRWPDEPASMTKMHRYEQALRPIVGAGAKFAVQSSGSAYWVERDAQAWQLRRQLDWDAALKPADWFEAVTVHLQTGLAFRAPGVPGAARMDKLPGADTREGMFRYMMAQADAGS